MESEDDFPMLQDDFHDRDHLIQYHTNHSLVDETTILQENNATHTLRPLEQSDAEKIIPTLPRIPEIDSFWPPPDPSHLPPNEMGVSESESESPSDPEMGTEASMSDEAIAKRNQSIVPTFYAQRNRLADASVNVRYVHSFRHKLRVTCVCFSQDGRYLAVATGYNNNTVFVYEVESRRKYCELKEYASQHSPYGKPPAWSMCFSPNGRYLAVANQYSIILWDVPNKRLRCMFDKLDTDVEMGLSEIVRFSPDGRLVAFRTDDGISVLNVRDNSSKMEFDGRFVESLDFSPNGRYIATANDVGEVMILNVRTGEEVTSCSRPTAQFIRVTFALDGRELLCVFRESAVEYWDVILNRVRLDEEPVLVKKFELKWFVGDAISPDQRLIATSNGEIRDAHRGRCQYKLKGHNRSILSLQFSPAGRYLAMGSKDHFVSLWEYT